MLGLVRNDGFLDLFSCMVGMVLDLREVATIPENGYEIQGQK